MTYCIVMLIYMGLSMSSLSVLRGQVPRQASHASARGSGSMPSHVITPRPVRVIDPCGQNLTPLGARQSLDLLSPALTQETQPLASGYHIG